MRTPRFTIGTAIVAGVLTTTAASAFAVNSRSSHDTVTIQPAAHEAEARPRPAALDRGDEARPEAEVEAEPPEVEAEHPEVEREDEPKAAPEERASEPEAEHHAEARHDADDEAEHEVEVEHGDENETEVEHEAEHEDEHETDGHRGSNSGPGGGSSSSTDSHSRRG